MGRALDTCTPEGSIFGQLTCARSSMDTSESLTVKLPPPAGLAAAPSPPITASKFDVLANMYTWTTLYLLPRSVSTNHSESSHKKRRWDGRRREAPPGRKDSNGTNAVCAGGHDAV